MKRKSYWGYASILASSLFWGTIPMFTRYLYQTGVSPVQAAGLRCYMAALLSLPGIFFCGKRNGLKGKDVPFYFLYGILAIGGTFLSYAVSIKLLPTAAAAVLLYTGPAFVNILNRIVYKIPLTPVKTVSLAATFCGCIMVAGACDPAALKSNLPGIATGILSGFFYSLTTVFATKGKQKYSGAMNGFLIQFFGAFAFVFLLPPWRIPALALTARQFLFLGGLALFATFIPYTLYLFGMGLDVDGGTASILATLEPAAATVYGIFWFGDRLESRQLLGIFVVLAGVLLPILEEKRAGSAVKYYTDKIKESDGGL